MTSQVNTMIETSLPIHILIRSTSKAGGDWLPFDIGPGYFDIPPGMVASISIHGIHDETIKLLVDELYDVDVIERLDLSENRNIGNEGMRWLVDMRQISDLNLSACGLNNRGLDSIIKMKNLRKLDISYCTRITDTGLKKIKEMRNLEELYIRGIPRITHAAIKWLERHDLVIKE